MGNVISQPSVTFSLVSADVNVANAAQKILIVGQYLVAGSGITDGGWERNIGNAGEENSLFFQSSMIASMIRAVKRIAPGVQLDAITLADAGGGVDRIVDIAFTGSASESGTFTIIAGSEKLHSFIVPVADGEPILTTIGTAAALINADLDCPFAAASEGPVTLRLTARNAGTVANDLPVGHSGKVAGIGINPPVNFTPGSTDPSLTAILDVIVDERYQAIVWPYSDRTVLTDLLDARFNTTNSVIDGVGFSATNDTKANAVTELASLNSQSLVVFYDSATSDTNYIGGSIAEGPYLTICYFAAIRALRLTPDEPISRFVTTNSALDQFGGPALASLPYFNTPIPQLPVPGTGRGFTDIEIEEIFDAGGAVIGQNTAGAGVIVGEVVTTYLTDPAANIDVTWKFLNNVDTASGAREYMVSNVKKRFAQSRLTGGAITPGRDMANRISIKAYLVQLYSDLASDTFALVQAGENARKFFVNNCKVTLDLTQGKATITMKLPIIVQLRVIIATVKIDFSVQS